MFLFGSLYLSSTSWSGLLSYFSPLRPALLATTHCNMRFFRVQLSFLNLDYMLGIVNTTVLNNRDDGKFPVPLLAFRLSCEANT